MADALPPLLVQIELDIAQLKSQAQLVQDQMKKMGREATAAANPFNKLGESAKGLAAKFGLVLGAGEIINFLRESGRAAGENNKSFAVYAQTMTNVVHASKDLTESTNGQIEKMGLLAGMTASQLRPSFDTILRTTKNTSQAMSELKLAMDVSAGTGRGLQGVSLLLSRALTGNVGALNRLVPGIKNAKDPVKALEQAFGGMAEKAANADPYQKLNAAMTTIKETVGTALLPVVQKFADWIVGVTPKIQDFFKQLNDPTTDVGRNWKQLQDAVKGVVDWLGKNLDLIKKVIIAYGIYKGVMMAYNGVLAIVTAAQWALNLAMDANPIGALILLVGGLAAAYIALSGAADSASYSIGKTADGITAGRRRSLLGSEVNGSSTDPYAGIADPSAASRAAHRGDTVATSPLGNIPSITSSTAAKAAATALSSAKQVIANSAASLKSAQDTYAKSVSSAYDAYTKAETAAAKVRDDALNALENSHANNVASITKSFTDKLTGIVQQSMDRLRNAFQQATQVDIGQMFSQSGTGIDGLISQLQTKLSQAKKLISNSAALSGAGFSQTFIEQVVAQGGDIGNTMADQILAATPETQKQLQDLFQQTQDTANTGMDALAKAIYDKNGLATDELTTLYKTTQNEMQQALQDETSAYLASMADIKAQYDTTLNDAHQTLVDNLKAAGTALNAALDKIDADLTSNLSKYKGQIGSLKNAIGSLRNAINSSYSDAIEAPGMGFSQAVGVATDTAGMTVNNNTTINATTAPMTAEEMTQVVTGAIRYGMVSVISAVA